MLRFNESKPNLDPEFLNEFDEVWKFQILQINPFQLPNTFTQSKLTVETQEKEIKYVQSKQKDTDVVLESLLLTLNIFYIFVYCFYC